ncbi:hypothetical protein [Paracoccus salipaludis]|uniref:Uncharacterized protein n=1 Tax=Paracoccus salipaludis TaxID=2032623 RepID=A0A2A2GNM9_9RHOB|nr:hypothetical protein [Paracoccus salipaludis]PAU98968.1 hypothetical protein CK240_02245 [Paracoccus salipaludis]
MTRPPKQSTFSVPVEMGERLRQIAAAKQCDSVFDLLSAYVREEIEAGTIPRGIPGITVSADGEEVRISANEFTLAVQRQLASRFAETLRAVARKDAGAAVPGVEIKRTGRAGLKIVRSENGSFLGLSDATAAELAGLIEEKAATA